MDKFQKAALAVAAGAAISGLGLAIDAIALTFLGIIGGIIAGTLLYIYDRDE